MASRALVPLAPLHAMSDYHYIESDFTADADTAEWVKTGDAAASANIGDAIGGIMAIQVGGTADNDECYVESPNETFKFVANKPLRFAARVQFSEASTNKDNIIVGLKDAVAADTLQDNGAGPASSYSGAVFFKQDGETLWSVEASIGSTQTTAQLTAANSLDDKAHTAGSSGYQWLVIEFDPIGSASADIAFFIDGVLVYKMTGDFITSATEMQICLGAKAGGSSAAPTLNVDFVSCIQKR